VLGLCACAYLYAFPYQPEINNPNENVRFYMTSALVEEHTYVIDTQRARWGWVNDAAVRDGHAYSVKAPGASELGVPGYWLYAQVQRLRGLPFDREAALWFCRVTGTALPSLFFLWFLHHWLLRRVPAEPVLADATVFAVGLGSLLYGYGMMFVSHTQSAAAAFGAFALLADARADRRIGRGRAVAAGFLAAAVTWLEYPAIFASVVLSLYALRCVRPWPRLAFFALGAAVPTLLMMHFQWKAFGSPFTPGHLFVENPAFRANHEQGLFGADGFHTEAFALLFDRGFGLFAMTPFLVFAALGLPRLLARRDTRPDAVAAFFVVALSVLAILVMRIWRGGWTIGPRYLALTVPFFAWWALEALGWLATRARLVAYALALGTCAAGLVASGIPSVYYPHIPEEITRPLPQLFAVLVTHGYAPKTALGWLDVHGGIAMIPLAVVALLALGGLVVGASTAVRRRRVPWALGLTVAAMSSGVVALLPSGLGPAETRPVVEARAFVTEHWQPAGHDRAARLEAELRARPGDAAVAERLASTYEAEGRAADAARVGRVNATQRP
jgi:hypothetical protein